MMRVSRVRTGAWRSITAQRTGVPGAGSRFLAAARQVIHFPVEGLFGADDSALELLDKPNRLADRFLWKHSREASLPSDHGSQRSGDKCAWRETYSDGTADGRER